jgi:cytochrome c peroxidase
VFFITGCAFAQRYGPLPITPANPVTAEKIALGKKLFSDTRLSSDRSTSCASCHDPKHAFADPKPISSGAHGRHGHRHAPSLIGRGYGSSQFWDGRAATLEEQVLQPILSTTEMDMTLDKIVAQLKSDSSYSGITGESIVQSLASYVRTIRSVDAPFDRHMAGAQNGLTPLAREGLRLFEDKARCYICHAGDRFTDESFHNTGIAWQDGSMRDMGRAKITGKSYDEGAFKTPTLREIANRAPYMHDGKTTTLEEVVDFYDRGGNANPRLDENMAPLHLSTEEKRALIAFLRALSGSVRDGF